MSIYPGLMTFDRPLGETDRRSPAYVLWVQASLNRVQSAGLAVDGKFGPKTRQAVQAFQRRAGLAPDGIVGSRTEAALIAAGAPALPKGGQTPTIPPLPIPNGGVTLLGTEATPPATTLYTNLALGGETPARAMTGIFVPPGYRPGSTVDLILYLHGHKSGFASASINAYWKRPAFGLREATNTSPKNVILVAPTLGPKSQAGWLSGPGGLDRYLDHVLTALHAHGPHRGMPYRPELGSLILACHSGGGFPMRRLALSTQRSSAAIRECWGFDCLYNTGDDTEWTRWAKDHPNARLFVHYQGSTARFSRALHDRALAGGLTNVSVSRSPAPDHNHVPVTHWQTRIDACGFLGNR